jgi:hypothetical protein
MIVHPRLSGFFLDQAPDMILQVPEAWIEFDCQSALFGQINAHNLLDASGTRRKDCHT